MQRAVVFSFVALACSASERDEVRVDVCVPVQWEACAHPCGHGVRHCEPIDSGVRWSECSCVVLDAALPQANTGGAGGTTAAMP
jgi:hypothetical protein